MRKRAKKVAKPAAYRVPPKTCDSFPLQRFVMRCVDSGNYLVDEEGRWLWGTRLGAVIFTTRDEAEKVGNMLAFEVTIEDA